MYTDQACTVPLSPPSTKKSTDGPRGGVMRDDCPLAVVTKPVPKPSRKPSRCSSRGELSVYLILSVSLAEQTELGTQPPESAFCSCSMRSAREMSQVASYLPRGGMKQAA